MFALIRRNESRQKENLRKKFIRRSDDFVNTSEWTHCH